MDASSPFSSSSCPVIPEDYFWRQRTQLAALRCVPLVDVRGSSIHIWRNWAKQGITVGEKVGVESLRSQEIVVRTHLSVVHNPHVRSLSVYSV